MTTAKLANDAVNTLKVADNSLSNNDLASNSVRGSELGPTQKVFSPPRTLAAGASSDLDVTCPAGTRVISGGFSNEIGVYAFRSFLLGGNVWRRAVACELPTARFPSEGAFAAGPER